MIRKLLVLGAFCFLLGMPPAFAAEDGFYLAGFFGATLVDEAENEDPLGTFHLDYDAGYGAGGILGYDLATAYPSLGVGRLELEVGFRRNGLRRADFLDGAVDAEGNITVLSFMANSFADYREALPWIPYVGVGFGYAVVALNDAKVSGVELADDEDGVFAYQLGAGVALAFQEHLTLDLGYRFFATADPDFDFADKSQGSFESEYHSHNLFLGIRATF